MWGSTGRSGYGGSTISGDYDSWDGISPNGRQYKNEATMETRDLSGADYWLLRKQNRPTEAIPAHLHMLKNGKANINAYADKEPVKKSRAPLKNRVLPQLTRYNNLTDQMKEIVAQYRAKEIDIEEYTLLLSVVSAKRARAEQLLAKAISVKAPFELEEEIPNGSEVSSREILSENKRSALKRKESKGACVKAHPKTENVKHDRKSLSKVADWINRNDWAYLLICSSIVLTAAKIIF